MNWFFEGKRTADLRSLRFYKTLIPTHRFSNNSLWIATFDAHNPTAEILNCTEVLEPSILEGNIDLNPTPVYNAYFGTKLRSLERFGRVDVDDGPSDNLDNYYFFDIP